MFQRQEEMAAGLMARNFSYPSQMPTLINNTVPIPHIHREPPFVDNASLYDLILLDYNSVLLRSPMKSLPSIRQLFHLSTTSTNIFTIIPEALKTPYNFTCLQKKNDEFKPKQLNMPLFMSKNFPSSHFLWHDSLDIKHHVLSETIYFMTEDDQMDISFLQFGGPDLFRLESVISFALLAIMFAGKGMLHASWILTGVCLKISESMLTRTYSETLEKLVLFMSLFDTHLSMFSQYPIWILPNSTLYSRALNPNPKEYVNIQDPLQGALPDIMLSLSLILKNTLDFSTQIVHQGVFSMQTQHNLARYTVIEDEYRKWYNKVPEFMKIKRRNFSLRDQSELPSLFAFLNIMYHVGLIRLYRTRLTGFEILKVHDHEQIYFGLALQSATTISSILEALMATDSKFDFFLPIFAYCVYETGLIHVAAAHITRKNWRFSKNALSTHIRVLEICRRKYVGVARLYEILRQECGSLEQSNNLGHMSE